MSTSSCVHDRDHDRIRGWKIVTDVADNQVERLVGASAVAFFTPACVTSGRTAEGLQLARRAGFRLLYMARVILTEDQVHRVWQPQAAGFAPSRWAVAVELFCAGPGIVALFGGDTPPVSKRFKEFQGPSSPRDLIPGQLRYSLGAVNKINNMVHVSSDSAAAVRELAILLGDAGATAAWRAALDSDHPKQPETMLDRLVGSDGNLSLPLVIGRLRWRGFLQASIETDAKHPPGLETALRDQLDWARTTQAQGWQATERWKATFKDRHIASRFARWIGEESPIVHAMRLLDAVVDGAPLDINDLRKSLTYGGLAPSRWESLLLASQVIAADGER